MSATRLCNRLVLAGLAAISLSFTGVGQGQAAGLQAEIIAPVPARVTASVLPEGWQHGAFAEIYVRGYQDSDGDGIGDLNGLTARLDYLQALGVRGLWLMPVTRSGDHDHGYSVEDYRDIEPAFGTLADFDELLAQAHARGIGVIVDYVINHSAASHPLFLAGASDHDSPYRRWYVWRDHAPAGWSIFGRDPWVSTANGAYFSQFSPSMPDFDLENPSVMAWHADNERFWLNRGVDGFRFDAVAHLVEHGKDAWRDQPENLRLAHAATQVAMAYPHRYVVCEVTRNPATYAAPQACGSAFAFELGPIAIAAARGEADAIAKLSHYFENAPPAMATMLANHDLFAGDRLWNQLAGDPAQYRLAAASYLLAPGTPFIYYGEEIGMASVDSLHGDRKLRTPMSWNGEAPGAGF
ncbi:MAG: alpha-amylase family glycosyl hydrolase, partial [Arenimonas sp.]